MVATVHRLPIDDSFNFQAFAGQLSARTCDDCGAPADVGLEYYRNGKYTPGEDLCWDCSDRYGPFTSDRAAEKAGREAYVNRARRHAQQVTWTTPISPKRSENSVKIRPVTCGSQHGSVAGTTFPSTVSRLMVR